MQINPVSAKTKALQLVAGLFCYHGACNLLLSEGETKKTETEGWLWF
ncbi:hypothetical protein FHS86_001276 [Roseimarinus sediminis]